MHLHIIRSRALHLYSKLVTSRYTYIYINSLVYWNCKCTLIEFKCHTTKKRDHCTQHEYQKSVVVCCFWKSHTLTLFWKSTSSVCLVRDCRMLTHKLINTWRHALNARSLHARFSTHTSVMERVTFRFISLGNVLPMR